MGFLGAAVIVLRGDKVQRRTIRRRAVTRSRNIQHDPDIAMRYLSRGQEMDNKRLIEILAKTLSEIRLELGLPDDNPVAYSYEINDRVLANDMSEVCRNELDRFVVASGNGLIYPRDLERLQKLLEDRFPNESHNVLNFIKATKNREHLAALSLSTNDSKGEIFVSMANTRGHSLTIEGWKFCKLIEERKIPQLLGTLGHRRDYREPGDPFTFNNNKTGELLAQFIPETSVLHVVCREEKGSQIHDKAAFVIDIDYALCVYITLKQLRDDKERFQRLKEQADTSIPCDLFDNLYTAS